MAQEKNNEAKTRWKLTVIPAHYSDPGHVLWFDDRPDMIYLPGTEIKAMEGTLHGKKTIVRLVPENILGWFLEEEEEKEETYGDVPF